MGATIFSPGPPDRLRRAAVVGLSVVLFATVFALRLAVERADDALLLFLALPIVLLAMEFELLGGLLGALAAACLTALYGALEHPDIGALGYLSRIIAFFLIGGVVGGLARR